MKREPIPSPFDWRLGKPSIVSKGMNTEAKLKAIATKRIATRRAAGDPQVDLKGTSRRADEILRTRKSLPVEGREAGQVATEKRRAASKAAI